MCALITKPYTFTNGSGNNVDATQINSNYDTIYSLVNGNLEAVNMKDSIITLAKLASETKVIESITHTPLTSNYTLTATLTAFITQSITLSAQRYCLFLFSTIINIPDDQIVYIEGHDGTTLTLDIVETVVTTTTKNITLAKHAYKQLASGAHTFYVKAKHSAGAGYIFGEAAGVKTTLTTIVFAF